MTASLTMAELLFFRDTALQLRLPMRQERLTIGRGPQSDFVIPDKEVSRSQCEIVRRSGDFVLLDTSGKGTLVSRRRAASGGTTLRDGDEIALGAYSVVFSALEAPTRAEVTTPAKTRKGKTGILKLGAAEALRSRLRVRLPEGESVVPLKAEKGFALLVGSAPEGTPALPLTDSFASGEHCRIAWQDGDWTLTDLKSSNGTFVEGVRVHSCALSGRQAIRVGETTLWFEQDFAEESSGERPLPGLVTTDAAMRPVVELVRRIAPGTVPVAIHGETGSGKEVIARAIHQLSPRSAGPFVALNCGALPHDTIESELFGHERGAFTGADKARPGAFAEADGGTLFLDEIGELPLNIQVKLLRVLERGEIRRLGGAKTETVSVRVLSATHRDLGDAVERGTFREDLYFRLFVAPIELPPLRRRPDDILPLAEFFANELTAGQSQVSFTAGARSKLLGHSWPGNARELRNVIQLALLNRNGSAVTEDDLVLRVTQRPKATADIIRTAGKTLEEIEREAYRLALERHDQDKKKALEELGVSRSTFFRRLEEFGLGRVEA